MLGAPVSQTGASALYMAVASAQRAFLLLSFIMLVIASPQTAGREGGREEVGAKQIIECMRVCAYMCVCVCARVCMCVCA